MMLVNWVMGVTMAIVLFVIPIVMSSLAIRRGQFSVEFAPSSKPGAHGRQIAASAFAYAIAYNLTFFVQELFLVLPKAFVPGLDPVLYHNNHVWAGDDPIALLFQGSGAIAIFIMGLMALLLLSRGVFQSNSGRLMACWLAFHGILQSTLQVPSGVLGPETDFGDTMNYLKMPIASQVLLATGAMLVIPVMARTVGLHLVANFSSASVGRWTVFGSVLAQIMLGTLLAAPFRWPGSLGSLVVAPTILGIIGYLWITAFLLLKSGERPKGPEVVPNVAVYTAGWIALLITFQFVLRPGIAF